MTRHARRVGRGTTFVTVLALASCVGVAVAVPAPPALGSTASRPTRPTVAPFPLEPIGATPQPSDGRIPNPATPGGRPLNAHRRCAVTFDTTIGATVGAVNQWITAHQRRLAHPTTICLAGTFRAPLRVASKTSTALLMITHAPGRTAVIELGTVTPRDVAPHQYWPVAAAISIVDSRDVAIIGLRVRDVLYNGPGQTPAGIDVTARAAATTTTRTAVPYRSACVAHHGTCGNIYLLDNIVTDVANLADAHPTRSTCGNPDVGAYGIVVIDAGRAGSPPLQHVVVEGNTIEDLRTGQSESLSIDGNVVDYLIAHNVLRGLDNIGIDVAGWEAGPVQPRDGLITNNRVANVDTLTNSAYASWDPASERCVSLGENAGGIYDDGAARLWIRDNVVWNTNQGISLDVETPGRSTSDLRVTGNVVVDSRGTSPGDPSEGPNPPGVPGRSAVAGHAYDALYLDTYGRGSSMRDVVVAHNVFVNQSQNFQGHAVAPVIDLAGNWRDVVIEHNVIGGDGAHDRLNPLVVLETPIAGRALIMDYNCYRGLSAVVGTDFENFATPTTTALSLRAWRASTRDRLDAHSAVGRVASWCATRHP